jgi:nucleoside-diphosphate-sugar epimerase
MRIFVTGATGFVGSAVVQELIQAGHQVLGLARSDAAARALSAARAQAHRGDLEDMESLRSGAAMSDGVIHIAFIHDFSKFKENCEIDRRAIEALGAALAGSGRPLIVTSGTGLLSPGRLATEETAPASGPDAFPRVSEQTTLSMASRGIRVSVVRLPPSVHGDGDHGFVPLLIGLARQTGIAAYPGEGLNRWPEVHRFDAAQLYRLVLETGAAGAAVSWGRRRGRAVPGYRRRDRPPPERARRQHGSGRGSQALWLVRAFRAIDNPASSQRTRELLGWQPRQPGLIADLDRPRYFQA